MESGGEEYISQGATSLKLIQGLLEDKDIKTTVMDTHVSTRTVLAVNSSLENLINKKRESML